MPKFNKYKASNGSSTRKAPESPNGRNEPKQLSLPAVIGGIRRRDALTLAAGAAAMAVASPIAGGTISWADRTLLRRLQDETIAARGILFDNTDRKYLTSIQSSAIREMVMEDDKESYRTDTKMFVGILQNSEADPLQFIWQATSPGNERNANSFLQTPELLEEAYQRDFEPGLAEAVNRGLQPAEKPEATPLMEAIQTAVLHARRVAGPSEPVALKVFSDLLPHGPRMSAYVSERNERHPSQVLPQRWSEPLQAACTIEIVGISRAGRRTRSGRDLGTIQRAVGRLIKQNLRERGAEVPDIDWI
ncbi:MAG: hypothetical protein AAF714_00410 [Pseudomonadota bacterium]